MMNLASIETPPLGSQERVNTTTTTTTAVKAKETISRNTCFHGHLDLSLGISLSRGGSGCDAAGCGGSEASYGGRQGSRGDEDVDCRSSGSITTTTTTNVLTAGLGHVGDFAAGGGWTAAFMPNLTGFMHPWSLAARQQKAAAEQDRAAPATYETRVGEYKHGFSSVVVALTTKCGSDAHVVPLPVAVGWPPVHTSRRNLVTSMLVAKPGTAVVVDGPKGATTPMPSGGEKNVVMPTDSTLVVTRPQANMFAKVHMEGYAIGRKINLRAHSSYDSLSQVLTKMTRNFFCPADCSGGNMGEEEFSNSDKFIFLYEDFEGDRMLVGDVPWELFLASAKKLYITRNSTSRNKGHGDGDKNGATEEAMNN